MKKLGFYALAVLVMLVGVLVTSGMAAFACELPAYEGFVRFAATSTAIVSPLVTMTLTGVYAFRLADKADRV